jgi:hypothetical protein
MRYEQIRGSDLARKLGMHSADVQHALDLMKRRAVLSVHDARIAVGVAPDRLVFLEGVREVLMNGVELLLRCLYR